MATDFLSTPSTATVAGLLVASLGAVYAYTRLGTLHDSDTRAHAHITRPSADGGSLARSEAASTSGVTRKGRKKKKGKGVGVGEAGDEGEGESKDKEQGEGEGGAAVPAPFSRVVPGDFEGVGAQVDARTDVGSQGASPAGVTSKQGNDGETKRKKKKKKQGKGKDKGEDKVGSATGKEVGMDVGRTAMHELRSGDSTDASVSVSLSVSASAPASSREVGRGSLRASTRPAPPSQPHVQTRPHALSQARGIRPSLSFDTDSSWTHVDHRRLKTSNSADGQARGLTDTMDVTGSDVASTASDSPVAERMDNVTTDMHGARANLVQRTLAEKFLTRPRKTGVDDMLEEPDFPTVARVIRVQPGADETPVPGFSWDDYGDVVEESLLIDDADQEDEGEWGIVKSRNRTRPPQTATTSTSHALATPETMTKKQRQNARKRELARSTRAEAEAARLEGFAKHKRELERLRIIEQSRQGGGKRPSGGMQATVDDRGKLVWE